MKAYKNMLRIFKNRPLLFRWLLLFCLLIGSVFFIASKPSRATAISTTTPQAQGGPDYRPTRHDVLLLTQMREVLALRTLSSEAKKNIVSSFLQSSFFKPTYGFGLVVYQGRNKPLRSFAVTMPPERNLIAALKIAIRNKNLSAFDFKAKDRCRIQMDFILEQPLPIDLSRMSGAKMGAERYEMGVDGVLAVYNSLKCYFLPGDAFTKSILSISNLRRYLSKTLRSPPPGEMHASRFRTESYISYQDSWLKLYRGYPVAGELTSDMLGKAVDTSIDYVLKHQKDDGTFLYYYDAATDSFVDREHPKRDPKKKAYYNELRHCGGAVLLLLAYQRSKNSRLIPAAQRAIDFTTKQIVKYRMPDGNEAGYVYFNKKAKLGGSGIALYLLSLYQHVTGDDRYAAWAKLLADHLASQIQSNGEFFYYYVYLDKIVTPERNREHFNFYYPGEAVMGLASYYKFVCNDTAEKGRLLKKVRAAMQFLLVERPKQYHQHYLPLPADSWLMMGVNELWDIPEMQKDQYKDFVFGDADQMVAHMYTQKDALYPDYTGSFYYKYGDFPYADGARAEGLNAALELAVKCGAKEKSLIYYEALKSVAWSTLNLCNTPESVYSVPRPDMAIGGIRFKHTRQWFRIDTIQHVAAFYLKFLPYWRDYFMRADND